MLKCYLFTNSKGKFNKFLKKLIFDVCFFFLQTQELSIASRNSNRLSEENAQLVKENESLNGEKSRLESENDALNVEKTKLEKQVETLSREKSQLQVKLTETEKHSALDQQKLRKNTAEIDELCTAVRLQKL